MPTISFNYLGQFDSQEGQWQVVAEGSGQAVSDGYQDDNIISVNGMLLEGRLKFIILSKLSKEQTNLFAKSFQQALEMIKITVYLE